MRGSFGEADITRNSGFESKSLEVLFNLAKNVWGEGGAFIVHGGDNSEYLKIGVRLLHDELHGFEELGNAFKGIKFGLNWKEKVVGGNHTVNGEEGEAWWKVDQNIVVIVANGIDGIAEASEFSLLIGNFHFGVGEFWRGRGKVEIFVFGMAGGGF